MKHQGAEDLDRMLADLMLDMVDTYSPAAAASAIAAAGSGDAEGRVATTVCGPDSHFGTIGPS